MSTNTSRRGPQAGAAGKGAGKKGKGGKKGGKPAAPVKVGKDRNWGPIAVFVAVGVVAAGIVAWAAVALLQQEDRPFQERAAAIEGVQNFRESGPELTRSHRSGPITYEMTPPVGGDHNPTWQNCNGTVYEQPIANEHAVHAMEHGAVWVAYDPALPQDQVDALARRVSGTDYTLMSPYEGLDAPISLQAWGYQLKVNDAGDNRIDEFMRTLRINARIELDATCGGGNTNTGTVPIG